VESGKDIFLCVIWEIILRDFWGYILRDRQLDFRIILLGRLTTASWESDIGARDYAKGSPFGQSESAAWTPLG
jgi:hypothetical protein